MSNKRTDFKREDLEKILGHKIEDWQWEWVAARGKKRVVIGRGGRLVVGDNLAEGSEIEPVRAEASGLDSDDQGQERIRNERTNPETCWHNVVGIAMDAERHVTFYCVSCETEAPPGTLDSRYEFDVDNNVYISSGRMEWTQTRPSTDI